MRNTHRFFSAPLITLLCILGLIMTLDAPSQAQDAEGKAKAESKKVYEHPLEVVAAAARLQRFGKILDAERVLLLGLREFPLSADIRHALAELYYSTQLFNRQKAKEQYLAILRVDDNDATAHHRLAQILFAEAFTTRFEVPADRDKHMQKVRDHLLRAIEINSLFLEAYVDLARTYRQESEYAENPQEARKLQRRYLEYAYKIAPKHPFVLEAMIRMLLESKEPEDAKRADELLTTLTVLRGKADGYTALSIEALLLQEPIPLNSLILTLEEANKSLSSIRNECLLSLAERCADELRNAKKESESALLEMQQLTRNWLLTLYRVFNVYDPQNQLALARPYTPDRAEDEIPENAKSAFPIVPEMCYVVASIWFDQMTQALRDRKPDLAEKCASAAMRNIAIGKSIERAIPDLVRMRANLNLFEANWDEARHDFLLLAELVPDDPRAALYAQQVDAFSKGEIDQPGFEKYLEIIIERQMSLPARVDQLNALIGKYPHFADAHKFRARLLLQMGLPHEALEHLKRALADYPEDYQAMIMKAGALMRIGSMKEALETLQVVEEANPDLDEIERPLKLLRMVESKKLDAMALLAYQRASAETMATKDRVALLKQAITLSPKFFEAQRDLTVQLIKRFEELSDSGDSEGALRAIDEAKESSAAAAELAKANEDHAQAQDLLAQVLGRIGDTAGAAKAFALAREAYMEMPRNDATDKLLARIFFNEAYLNHVLKLYVKTNELMQKCLALGLKPEAFQPHRAAVEHIQSNGWQPVRGQDAGAVSMSSGLALDTTLKFEGGIQTSVTRNVEKESKAGFTLSLKVLETASIKGYWKLEATIFDISSAEIPLPDKTFSVILEVSPWFGLISHEATAEIKDQEATQLIARAIVEMFTLQRGNVDCAWPFLWNYPTPNMGVLNIGNDAIGDPEQCVFINRADADGMEINRLEIAEFMDRRARNGDVYPQEYLPRRSVFAELVLDGPAAPMPGVPTSIGVTAEHSYMVDVSGNGQADDVETSSISVLLTRKDD